MPQCFGRHLLKKREREIEKKAFRHWVKDFWIIHDRKGGIIERWWGKKSAPEIH